MKETWLTSEQTRILSEVLNSRAFQSLIGAEEWDLTEPDEEMLWDIIKAWPK